jgi:galactose mutarotase-like enzyme
MIETIENDILKIEIASAGAELNSIYHKQRHQEYLWQGNPDWWPRHAPVLFPIVGKLNGNSYRVNGKNFTLPQHGFARDNEFTAGERNDNAIEFILKSNSGLFQKYPFAFVLKIRYTLTAAQLQVVYEVGNMGLEVMYFSIGAHPGFALQKGENLSAYYIEFQENETLDRHLLENGNFNGKTERVLTNENTLPLYDDLFQKDAIVFKNMKSGWLYLKSRKSDYMLKFSCKDFPYFGIWSKPGASFVCLEPWYGLADSDGFEGEFSAKEGIQHVKHGETFSCTFSIEI